MKRLLTLALTCLLSLSTGWAQEGQDETPLLMSQDYTPAPENLEARQWFQDARFGMFIHWGVYSVLGGGGDIGVAEWVMQQKQIPIEDYEKLPQFFNPMKFNAKEWVQLAKDAGMKYITITSKHHDGFAMYDSQVSDYDIVDSTPYGKDIIKQLKEACDEAGIKLFFYYSQLDWHHPDYFPRGRTGQDYTGRPESGDWKAYLNYQNTQLRELLTNYGEIGGIWFDGWWDRQDLPNHGDWNLTETYSLIHELQPQAMIGNNHHVAPFPGEDLQMFEKDLPGQNTSGYSADSEIGELPLETCETMNGSWGFNLVDDRYKSPKDLIQYLVKAAGYNANFLLNVGPMPNGEIQPEFQKNLREMGKWVAEHGETIYGTRGGPVPAKPWGVTTQKGNKVFVHILNASDESILLPPLDHKIKSATLYGSNKKVKYEEGQFGLVLNVPSSMRNDMDTIVELTMTSSGEVGN